MNLKNIKKLGIPGAQNPFKALGGGINDSVMSDSNSVEPTNKISFKRPQVSARGGEID